ncbi:CPA1 family monovalent cation:H+ antiporter [Kibdelosporangium banguiense]|uniref:CPA1 family monovalent cation:H+ antiporter n=1 Tax=Kibdelosporangium banguiense TaxID=1365924 RepID=A0ABS4TN96_9PSEU|nr:Na+/H+ antiporter [Kibdelosporangium banguiense]MBP2325882.1 CPA1 family monovalent cation:H+ antiporter [Kibdelosporangium banguiense]
MHIAAEIVALVVAVLIVTVVARRLAWSAPLCLITVGIVVSYVPGVPEFHLYPEVVLVGLLPPLLYSTAIQTSLLDFRKMRGPITLLSVGLVLFTAVGVGLVAWAVIPGLPLAAGIALGAVVAPPDAVAASAVARQVPMPRKLVRLLEGESLFNDAAALVALRTAITAIAGTVSLWQVGWDFLVAAVGGVAAGALLGFVTSFVRAKLNDTVTDTALTLAVPFAAYIIAEELHGSGVLAVVTAGLIIGHKSPSILSGSTRLASRHNWQTVEFVLENLVFLLIGLQVRRIIEEVSASGLSAGMLIGICTAVLGATIVTRVLWMIGIGLYKRLVVRLGLKKTHVWPWRYSAVIAWAGMRGVVTLAAAFILPLDTPQRAVLVLAALVVVAGTLAIQGMTLARLIRRLKLPGPDPAEDALQEAAVLNDMSRVALDKLDEIRKPEDPAEVVERIRVRLRDRTDAAWEQLGRQSALAETPSDAYRRLRIQLLAIEREECLKARDNGTADDIVLRRVLEHLDFEESMLDRDEEEPPEAGRELSTPKATAGSCKHLTHEWRPVDPSAEDSCAACLEEGLTWVHLRMCLKCGNVACCDSSVGKHATQHFHDTRHPVMRSYEPGETWRWCFVDIKLG